MVASHPFTEENVSWRSILVPPVFLLMGFLYQGNPSLATSPGLYCSSLLIVPEHAIPRLVATKRRKATVDGDCGLWRRPIANRLNAAPGTPVYAEVTDDLFCKILFSEPGFSSFVNIVSSSSDINKVLEMGSCRYSVYIQRVTWRQIRFLHPHRKNSPDTVWRICEPQCS
jgi:hypothetical protein